MKKRYDLEREGACTGNDAQVPLKTWIYLKLLIKLLSLSLLKRRFSKKA